jgi:hypothetical protein
LPLWRNAYEEVFGGVDHHLQCRKASDDVLARRDLEPMPAPSSRVRAVSLVLFETHNCGGAHLNYVVLTLLSVALLLATVMLVKEHRLRRAVQEVLRRLLHRWRTDEHFQASHHRDRHDSDNDDERM